MYGETLFRQFGLWPQFPLGCGSKGIPGARVAHIHALSFALLSLSPPLAVLVSHCMQAIPSKGRPQTQNGADHGLDPRHGLTLAHVPLHAATSPDKSTEGTAIAFDQFLADISFAKLVGARIKVVEKDMFNSLATFAVCLSTIALDPIGRVSEYLKYDNRVLRPGIPLLFEPLWRERAPWTTVMQWYSSILASKSHPVVLMLTMNFECEGSRQLEASLPEVSHKVRVVIIRDIWMAYLKGPRRL